MSRPIDAEKAIDWFKPYLHTGESIPADVVIEDLRSMPTITPQNEWVSVKDRLPPLRENVLVCAYWHEHWGVYMGWNSGHGWTVSCGIGQRADVQVSHWASLPAPPYRRPPEAANEKDRTGPSSRP